MDRLLLAPDPAPLCGASLLVTHAAADWRQHTVLAFHLKNDGIPPTESAFTWELLALSTAIQVTAGRPHVTIHSDCQGAIARILNTSSAEALLGDHSVILYPVTCLAGRPDVVWTRGHPERREADKTGWTHSDWGIHLADQAADPRPITYPFPLFNHGFPVHRHEIATSAILRDCHSRCSWRWTTADGLPILDELQQHLHRQRLDDYLEVRDRNHTDPSAVSWRERPWRFAAKTHRFASSTYMQRARSQRLLFNWVGIGCNLHRDNPLGADAHCVNCAVPEDFRHVAVICQEPAAVTIRTEGMRAADRHIHSQRCDDYTRPFLHAVHAIALQHQHSHLLLSGSLTSGMCAELAPHLALVGVRQLPNLRRSLLALLTIYKDVGHTLVHNARQGRAPVPAAQGRQHRPREGLRIPAAIAAPRQAAPAANRPASPAAAAARLPGPAGPPPPRPRVASARQAPQKRPGHPPASKLGPPSKRQLRTESAHAAAAGGQTLFAHIRMQQRTVTEYFQPVARAAPIVARKHALPPPSPL